MIDPRFLDRELVAGDGYELVPRRRWNAEERAALAELAGRPDVFGVLRPVAGSGRTYKLVNADLATLLESLATPRRAGDVVPGDLDAQRAPLARLVLDGVLRVAEEDGFVQGRSAAPIVLGAPPDPAAAGRIGRLSLAALRDAADGDLDDLESLAAALYGANRAAPEPALAGRPESSEAVLAYLGLREPAVARIMRRRWRPPEPTGDTWMLWRQRRAGPPLDPERPQFKLYVSPATPALADGIDDLMRGLADSAAVAFKLGRHAEALRRPDKLVAYFRTRADTRAAAEELSRLSGRIASQGVPFSAPVDEEGLVSWGVDPPASHRLVSWRPAPSWRTWVTDRLAASLLACRRDGADPGGWPPWRFALERLRLDGVDVDRWRPPDDLWA